MVLNIDCHRISRKLSTVGNGIHFLWSRLAELGSEGKMVSQHHQGRKKKANTYLKVLGLLPGVLVWSSKQTCKQFFAQKNTKESKKYDLVSPPPQERTRGERPRMLFRSELSFTMGWRGEQLCWKVVLHQAGWVPPTPILNGASVSHKDSWKSDLGSADVLVISILNYGRHAIKEECCDSC